MSSVSPNGEKPNVSRRHLLPEECRSLITAAGKRGRCRDRDKALLSLIWRHGLRSSEGRNMLWEQVDLNNGTLSVRQSKSGTPSIQELMPDEIVMLRKLREHSKSEFVFESERGRPVSADTLARICENAGVEAGLNTRVHPQMLRHSSGHYLISKGVDARQVQDFLGHVTIQATSAYYNALTPARPTRVRIR